MFFEDVNTIYEKYKYLSFWYELSYDELVNNLDNYVDFIEITYDDHFHLNIQNKFWTGYIDIVGDPGEDWLTFYINEMDPLYLYSGQTIKFLICVDKQYELEYNSSPTFIVRDSLIFLRNNTNGWNRKIYIDYPEGEFVSTFKVGSLHYNENGQWVISQTTKQVQNDYKGYYVTPHYTTTMNEIFYISDGEDTYYLGKIILVPQLPLITYDTLYKDGKQHIQLYFDGNLIDDKYYSIIYKNEVLKDNIIDISEDINQIDIKINLNHPDYIKTTLDYSIPVNYFVLSSISDINIAKQKGVRTVINNEYDIVESLNISDIKLISNSLIVANKIHLENATLISDHIRVNNVYLKDSKIQVETIRPDTNDFTNIECISSNINDTILLNCKIKAYGNCIYENNEFNNCLIISDSDNISILNNTFNEVFEYADYFPNTLYLTGNLNCQGNTFIQEQTFTELNFNVALLKTIPETDINNFINLNTFNLNNTINNTVYTGLFYNLIDTDDLIYKELD